MDKLSNRMNEVAKILKELPPESRQDVLDLLRRHSCREIKELIKAANKIIFRIENLEEKQARIMVERARDLNEQLDQMRSKRDPIPDMI